MTVKNQDEEDKDAKTCPPQASGSTTPMSSTAVPTTATPHATSGATSTKKA